MRYVTWLYPIACLLATGAQSAPSTPQSFNLHYEHVPNQLIVSFEEKVDKDLKEFVVQSLRKQGRNSGSYGLNRHEGETVLLQMPTTASKDLYALAKEISRMPGVRYVEANNIYHLEEIIPDDPQFEKLYGLKNVTAEDSPISKDIAATQAWEVSVGSKDVVVAVIDTGIDYNHPDIAPNYWTNPGETGLDENGNDRSTNGIDDDGNGFVDDFRGWDFFNDDNDPLDGNSHGTHCAGTIGAKGNNGIGVVGVNWDVSLVGIKIFSDSGVTNTAAISAGIDYAVTLGVDVTSNSWGGGPESEAIREAIERANDKGILFVAASGNSATDTDESPHYPSSYDIPNIIAVASTDRDDNLSVFSNYGRTTVDVAAPGSDIYSTTPNDTYGFKSGTSMATPHVAGIAALVKSVYPNLSHIEIKDRILSTSVPLPSLTGKVKYGRVNAFSALELDEVNPSTPTTLIVVDRSISDLTMSWTASGDDGTDGFAARYELRYNEKPIDDSNWSESTLIGFEIQSFGTEKIVASISGLDFETKGYLAVRAFDNVGNASNLSESVYFELKPIQTIFTNTGTVKAGFETIDSPWGDVLGDEFTYISDSPEGNYENNVDASLVTSEFSDIGKELVLVVETEYDLETRYDYGYIDISVDNGEWQTVREYNGRSEKVKDQINLSQFLLEATSFKLRFRITTDGSVTREGWSIFALNIIGPMQESVDPDPVPDPVPERLIDLSIEGLLQPQQLVHPGRSQRYIEQKKFL